MDLTKEDLQVVDCMDDAVSMWLSKEDVDKNDYGRCKECETKKCNVLLTETINGIQVSVIEHGDFFREYEVLCESEDEIGFGQTYKYNHQALEVFNIIVAVLKMKSN